MGHAKIFIKKRTFLEPLVIFTNLQKNFQKFLDPSIPWNEFAAPRTLQIIENGPWLKKSSQPCYSASCSQT